MVEQVVWVLAVAAVLLRLLLQGKPLLSQEVAEGAAVIAQPLGVTLELLAHLVHLEELRMVAQKDQAAEAGRKLREALQAIKLLHLVARLHPLESRVLVAEMGVLGTGAVGRFSLVVTDGAADN